MVLERPKFNESSRRVIKVRQGPKTRVILSKRAPAFIHKTTTKIRVWADWTSRCMVAGLTGHDSERSSMSSQTLLSVVAQATCEQTKMILSAQQNQKRDRHRKGLAANWLSDCSQSTDRKGRVPLAPNRILLFKKLNVDHRWR